MKLSIGNVTLGEGKIPVQSMTKVKTSGVEECAAQILRLEEAGCEIVRVAVLDEADALSLKALKEKIHIPLVADIHFSARLAVLAAENGADKLRVNPGNIGGEREISLVADALKRHHIPVRVGANTGSISKEFYQKYGRSEEALVESALFNVSLLERHGVSDIVISCKATDVLTTVRAYRLLKEKTPYPLHLGVTEAGVERMGIVKSSIGIGSLLLDGIGDTIRVSLSAEPEKEAIAGHDILRACGLERDFVEVVSCPTCGRCRYDCVSFAEKVEKRVRTVKKKAKIAVMGCVVNGPGEAKECDLGIAGGDGVLAIFERGEIVARAEPKQAEALFFERLENLLR